MHKLFSIIVTSAKQAEQIASLAQDEFPLRSFALESHKEGLLLTLFFDQSILATPDELSDFLDRNFTNYSLPQPVTFYQG